MSLDRHVVNSLINKDILSCVFCTSDGMDLRLLLERTYPRQRLNGADIPHLLLVGARPWFCWEIMCAVASRSWFGKTSPDKTTYWFADVGWERCCLGRLGETARQAPDITPSLLMSLSVSRLWVFAIPFLFLVPIHFVILLFSFAYFNIFTGIINDTLLNWRLSIKKLSKVFLIINI